MPNIEIHGCQFGSRCAADIKSAVVRTLKKTKFKKEIVVTVVHSFCEDLKGIHMPFVRVCDTNMVRAEEIAQSLRGMRPDPVDVEVMQLQAFYEKI